MFSQWASSGLRNGPRLGHDWASMGHVGSSRHEVRQSCVRHHPYVSCALLFAPSTHMLLECADVEKKSVLPLSLCRGGLQTHNSAAHGGVEVCLCIVPLLSHRDRTWCVHIFWNIRGLSSKGATQRLLYRRRIMNSW